MISTECSKRQPNRLGVFAAIIGFPNIEQDAVIETPNHFATTTLTRLEPFTPLNAFVALAAIVAAGQNTDSKAKIVYALH